MRFLRQGTKFALPRKVDDAEHLAAAPLPQRTGDSGRPRKVGNADAAKARSLRDKGIAATDIAKMLGVSRATVYIGMSPTVCRSLRDWRCPNTWATI